MAGLTLFPFEGFVFLLRFTCDAGKCIMQLLLRSSEYFLCVVSQGKYIFFVYLNLITWVSMVIRGLN